MNVLTCHTNNKQYRSETAPSS